MTLHVFNMANTLEAVDLMVLTLNAIVEDILPKTTRMKFEICVSEALTNLVKHAHPVLPDAQIEIRLINNETNVIVVIFDPSGATPFDLRKHAVDIAGVDHMAEHGRGLALILQCADRIDYCATNGRYRLSMEFENAN